MRIFQTRSALLSLLLTFFSTALAAPAASPTAAPKATPTAAPKATPTAAPKATPTAAPTPSVATPTPSVPEKPNATPAEQLQIQNKKYQSLESFSYVLNLLESRYVDEKAVSNDILLEKAIRGIVAGLDPHTIYLPPTDLREFQNDTSGKFGGVGIVITQTNRFLEVVEVLADSPAARSGIQAGDIIYSIENTPVTIKNAQELLNRIRGDVGSVLEIEVVPAAVANEQKLREGKNFYPLTDKHLKTKKYKMRREIIRTSSVSSAKLSEGYAYARITIFQEDTGESLDKALSKLEEQNGGRLKGFILDLRDNPGGLFDQAVRVADLFLDSGIIVSTIGRDKAAQSVEYATTRDTHPAMPMVVLVNERSASASEIVAGALQDHNRAIIMGTTSFGKGSVQQIVQLPNGGGLKMTIARYYTPKGKSIQAKGIVPDVVIAQTQTAKDGEKKKETSRKEADLEGHIDATDLNTNGTNGITTSGGSADSEKWPANLRNDNLVRSAFAYLKGWERFQK